MSRLLFIAPAVALPMSGVTSASEPVTAGLGPLPSEAAAMQLLRQVKPNYTDEANFAKLNEVLALLPKPTPFRGQMLCLRGQFILEKMGPRSEARQDIEECNQLTPGDPRAMVMLSHALFDDGEPVRAAQLFIRAGYLAPEVAEQFPADMVASFTRQLNYAGEVELAARLRVMLAEIGWREDYPFAFAEVAEDAIDWSLARGDREVALATLYKVIAPDTGISLLTSRQYQAIWPEVEAWAGGDLSRQRHLQLEVVRDAYMTSGAGSDRLDYIYALEQAGELSEAINVARNWFASQDVEDDPYYRNNAAVALGRLMAKRGEREEGIALMKAALVGSDFADQSAINIVPNLVVQMLLAEDYEGALTILDKHQPTEEMVEAKGALGYFVALRACAVKGRGQVDAALDMWDEIKTLYSTNVGALLIAASCLGTPDQIAAAWIKLAESEEGRRTALRRLQEARAGVGRGLPVQSIEDAGVRQIINREDVMRTYEKYARPLPASYEPALLYMNDQ